MTERTCKHPDGCARVARKRGWCEMHYQRMRAHDGDPGPAEKVSTWGNYVDAICTVDGCETIARARGMCMFHYGRLRHNGVESLTRPKRRAWTAEERAWTPSQRHRFFKYGLTPAAFEEILARQGGKCYVCRTVKPGGLGWSVDHCHESLVVRFILCNPCNAALGLIRESPRIAKRLYEVVLEIQQMKLIP